MTDENGNLIEFTAEQLAELADASLDELSESDLENLKRQAEKDPDLLAEIAKKDSLPS